MRDTIKPLFASAGGLAAQFADIDIAIKVLIGIMTVVYLGLKIYGEWKRQQNKKEL